MTADDKAAVKSPAGAGGGPPVSELKVLGKYHIEKKIGAGGMGAVYLARDTELKRTVALKVLPRDKAENPILVRRFRAEAQAAAQLRHPNIVAVYDSGEADGHLYIAMEYVEGKDLFELVSRRGTVPVRRSIDIIKQVAEALQHAFEQNIVHRDIKPSNLLIRRDGVVKLTDLGLARSIDDTLETNITRAGTTVGTVDYMAPEQARNSKLADIRSDLYSLGCTWYQMLTGTPPYPEGSVTNKLQAHAIKPVPDPRDKNPQVPEGLTAVMRRMMAKKPEDRYQTPEELLDELAHATLTNAAISREIFADDSDDDDGASSPIQEEALSGDSYFELSDTRRAEATPDQVAAPDSPNRRKTVRPSSEPAETSRSTSRTKSSPGRETEAEPEPEPQAGRRFKPIPAKNDRPIDQEPVSRSDRSTTEEADEPGRDTYTRKSKPRPGKSEPHEPLPKGTSKGPEPKAADPKGAKPKGPGQKQLPPKLKPSEDQPQTEQQGTNLERFKYFAVVGGLVAIIIGAGWLISRFGNNVEMAQNPFVAPENQGANPAVPNVAGKTNPANPGDSVDPNTTTVVNPGNSGTNQKPEGPSQAFDVEKIPDWANQQGDPPGLANFTVSAAAKSETNFPTLDEALNAVPGAGAIIKLQGIGPFPLPPVNLAQRKRIVLTTASPQDRPVIMLKPGDDPGVVGLTLSDGTLELRGLHFTIERQVFTGPLTVVRVVDGQLMVQQCSFTATGTSSSPIVAMSVESTADSSSIPKIEPRLLVDRVLVRGDGLTGLKIDRANIDAVVRDSLLVTGPAPCIEVDGHVVAAISDVVTTKPRRILRIQRCTFSAQNRVFDLSVDESGKPPETAVAIRDSLCTAQGVVANSVIIGAARWPQVRSNDGWLTRLSWTSTNTLYMGFEQLIDLGSSFKVLDASTWQRVWGAKVDARQFQKQSFPPTALEDLHLVQPHDFDSNGLAYRDLKATDGGLPGCPVGKLSVPDVTSQQRAAAISLRPALPAAAVKPPEPSQVRKVDLKKEDLGAILARADWPSGTLFEASGGGICTMTPTRIEGKNLRIVFRQTDGTTLKMQPLQPKSTESARTMPSALISITNGMLELTNVVLEGSPNSKAITPEWLVQSTNSTVILDGCRLLGSEADGSKQIGLIHWNTSIPIQGRADSVSLVVRDCYLTGSGCGVRTECGHGNLIFRNTILAIRGDALDLRPIRAGNALLPVVDAENVTISATGAAVRFQAAPGTEAVTSPVRLFMEKTVFAPPLAFKAGEATRATLLNCVGPVFEQKQLEWWGASNGIAKQVVYLLRQDDDQNAPSDERTGLSAWRKAWDKANSVRFLSGDKGVYLVGELPVRWRELKPGSFELHKGSQAATWGDGGRPIGANPRAIEDSSLVKKGEDSSKPKVNPAGANKKNVGF